jgi:hypothetical protein
MVGMEYDDGVTTVAFAQAQLKAPDYRPDRCRDTAPLRGYVSGSSDSGGLAAGFVSGARTCRRVWATGSQNGRHARWALSAIHHASSAAVPCPPITHLAI